jgi:hypothetical protein
MGGAWSPSLSSSAARA